MDLERVKTLSLKELKTPIERFVKLSEECGELAQEILIACNASGSQHKKAGDDGIKGEAVDVMLVALSIFFKHDGSISELSDLINKKCAKWEKWQKSI